MQINVPATSANLGPGFDTLGLAVNLLNTIKIEEASTQTFQVLGEGSTNPKILNSNLFLARFNKIFYSLTGEKANYRFTFTNKIPISRGLGSSSAVIVGSIVAAYKLANEPITKEEVLNLSLEFEKHPDNIAPATMGGFTASTLVKGKVKTIKADIPDEIVSIVVIPNKPISTRYARNILPESYPKHEAVFNITKSSYLTAAFLTHDWDSLKYGAVDRMHEYYRMKLFPNLFYVKKQLHNSGALMTTLSGSGSTMFSLFYRDDAKKVIDKLKKNFPYYKVVMLDFDNKGYEIID